MRVVMLDAPQELIDARRRQGHDHLDEMWEGVLHMVPQPSDEHQGMGSRLLVVLAPIAGARGLVSRFESPIHVPGAVDEDYRVPDLLFARPSQLTKRGVVGPCELAVEILSPRDETYEKIPFYAAVGLRELLIVDPATRHVELFARKGRRLAAVRPRKTGELLSRALGVTFRKVRGPKLRLSWDSGVADV